MVNETLILKWRSIFSPAELRITRKNRFDKLRRLGMGIASISASGPLVTSPRLATKSCSIHSFKKFSFSQRLSTPLPLNRFTLRARSYEQGKEMKTVGTVEENKNANLKSFGTPFVVVLALAVAGAAAFTFASIHATWGTSGSCLMMIQPTNESSLVNASPVGFTFSAFGYRVILPEYAPGWVYFWLLMLAGCGLFISEEALNIWVGISLSRMLVLDDTWLSFVDSLSRNLSHIISTILWVYWGVCISDMIPFFLGRAFKGSGASDDICSKLGIGQDKVKAITKIVQSYGNLAGFVERFSIGVRNPTAFLAGMLSVSPECFFGGVCLGGLITVSLQLGIGFLLRERPVFALASVATVVGVWTVFPYLIAASTAVFIFLRGHSSKGNK